MASSCQQLEAGLTTQPCEVGTPSTCHDGRLRRARTLFLRKRCYIPALSILLVVLGLVATIACLPAIAKHVAAGAELTLSRVELWDLQEDSAKSRIRGTVRLPKPPLTPACHMEAAELTLSYDFGAGSEVDEERSQPLAMRGRHVLGRVRAPAMNLGAQTEVDITNELEITDAKALAEFSVLCMNSESDLTVEITGSARASMFGIGLGKIPLHLNVQTWALSSIRRMEMVNFTLSGSDSSGVRMNATVAMSNPGGLSIHGLGTTVVNISAAGYSLGNMWMPELHLETGRVELAASGHVLPDDPDSAAALFSSWLLGGRPSVAYSVVPISGNSSVPTWARTALGSLQGIAQFPHFSGASLIKDIKILGASFNVDERGDIKLNGTIDVSVETPFGFSFDITALNVSSHMVDATGIAFATLNFLDPNPVWRPDPARPGCGIVEMQFSGVDVKPLNVEAFGRLTASFMGNASTMTLGGTATVTTKSVLGELSIAMPMQGVAAKFAPAFHQFTGMQIPSMDMVDGTPGHLHLRPMVLTPNPSVLAFSVTPCLRTTIGIDGTYIGTANFCNIAVHAGGTTTVPGVQVDMHANSPAGEKLVQQCIERYVSGKDTMLEITGDPKGSTDPAAALVRPALGALRSQTLLKGLPQGIISSATLGLLPDRKKLPSVLFPVTLFVDNPWHGNMNITYVHATVFAPDGEGYGLLLGEVPELDLRQDPLVIQGKNIVKQPQAAHQLPVHLLLDNCIEGHLTACIKDVKDMFFSKGLTVRIKCRMRLIVGHGFELEVNYSQDGVPINLR